MFKRFALNERFAETLLRNFYLNSHFNQMWLFQSTDSVYLCVNQ